jgi:hypothetical protein
MVLTWFSSLFWILCFSSINTFNQLVLRMSFKCSWKMRCSIWSETIFQVYEQEYKKDLTLLMLLSSRHLKQFWCIIPTNETFVRSDRAVMALLSRKKAIWGVRWCAAVVPHIPVPHWISWMALSSGSTSDTNLCVLWWTDEWAYLINRRYLFSVISLYGCMPAVDDSFIGWTEPFMEWMIELCLFILICVGHYKYTAGKDFVS